jgi:N-acetylmuramoyl-L-alanine amidase
MFWHKRFLIMRINYKILCLVLSFLVTGVYYTNAQNSSGRKIKTVVIDPGHGGRDPGAVGRISKEKDLVLAIGLKLRDYIQDNYKDVKVVMTREDDTFLELFKRADIANKNNADLFISLHINASTNTQAHGTETFVMGLHRSQSNLEVAMKENSVIEKEEDFENRYGGFDPSDPESHVLFSLFQNAFLNQSVLLAQFTQDYFDSNLDLSNRGVKQAGFLVLWRTSMPSILVEAGFISNPEEEKLLNTEKGQDKVAYSIFQAFSRYKKYYEDDSIELKDEGHVKENIIKSEVIYDTIILKETDLTKNSNIENNINKNLDSTPNLSDEGIVFKVQIATSSKKIELIPEKFKSYQNVEVYLQDNIYCYTIGKDKIFETISDLKNKLSKDFPDCFIVAFKNGKRVNVTEARREQNQ